MPTTYRTHNGRIRGEATGGVLTTYLTDALGSVTATVDASATVVNTYRAKPYGQRLAKTGTGADPVYEFAGDTGSRRTGLAHAEQHNRARHLGTQQGAWTSVDPLWPYESAYGYVGGNPTTWTDPSGMKIDPIQCGGHKKSLDDCCAPFRKGLSNDQRDGIKACMAQSFFGAPPFANGAAVDAFLDILSRRCGSSGGLNNTCVRCADANDRIPMWNKSCRNPCQEGFWAYTFTNDQIPNPNSNIYGPGFCGLAPYSENCPGSNKGSNNQTCSCSIVMCASAFDNDQQSGCAVLFHEMGHCSGLGHVEGEIPPRGVQTSRPLDFIYKLGCCTCRVLKGAKNCGSECDVRFR